MTELEFYKNWCSVILDYQYEDTILWCKSRNNFEELREDFTNLFNDMRYRLLEDCKKARMVNVKRWFSSLNEGFLSLATPTTPFSTRASLPPVARVLMTSTRSDGKE